MRLLCLRFASALVLGRQASSKTTAMGKSAYAVVVGRRPGVYTSWEQCLAQVRWRRRRPWLSCATLATAAPQPLTLQSRAAL